MPLLMFFRRWWAVLFFAILCLPAIGHFTPDLPAPMRTVLEPEKNWWEDASRRLDPYINNVFGFRGAVLAAHQRYLRFIDEQQNERVLEGENGSLFIRDNQALEQSIGHLMRTDSIERFTEFTRSLDEEMKALGGRFVALLAPNAHTANFEELPAYARRQKREPTEYDVLAERMKAENIPFVDLRPDIAAAKQSGRVYYRYDTHWNDRGGLLAFNAAMKAVGRPDLAVSEEQAFEPTVIKPDGDLLRLGNIESREPPDISHPWKAPIANPQGLTPLSGIIGENENPLFRSEVFETGHEGPRIMVVGDSFTRTFWRDLLAYRASAFLWTHHQNCNFDQEMIARFKPDILIYIPTERFMPCIGPRKPVTTKTAE